MRAAVRPDRRDRGDAVRRVWSATFPDGSQVMVEHYDETDEWFAAKRDHRSGIWGPPQPLKGDDE